jgi:hypothetical protein
MDMKELKLMKGDWVMYNPNVFIEDEYEPAKSWYATTIANGADIDLAEEGCYEPIPLTEEFFEKNGFKKAAVFDIFKMFESADKRIQITDCTNSGDGYWYVHVDNEDYDTIGNCDVKYVHQFQQLLRLCGYEMDVVV